MNDEIRLQRRARLMDNKVYQSMQSLIDGDEAIIKQVNRRALQSAIVLLVLLLLIALMIWALVSFGSYLYSLIASIS